MPIKGSERRWKKCISIKTVKIASIVEKLEILFIAHIYTKKIKHHDFGRKCDLEAIPLKEVKNNE